ncbi:MAG: IS200/IS605 family transposase [Candidatus Brocadiia bacterium]
MAGGTDMAKTYTKHLYHIVFSTKERKSLLTEPIRNRLRRYASGVARRTHGHILAMGGVRDHVHILASVRPIASVSDFVRTIKANTSRWLSQTFPELRPFAWQAGYASFTVSESNREDVQTYIALQEEHHSRMPFAAELARLLDKHGVVHDNLS